MNKLILSPALAAAILFLPLVLVLSQENEQPQPKEIEQPELQFYLRLDKLTFYEDENITLRLCVKNPLDTEQSFTIYEKKGDINADYITYQPVVFDMKGNEVENLVPYKTENKDPKELMKDYTKRTIQLGPHEEIMHKVNIRLLYTLGAGKRYRIKGFFFPDFETDFVIHSSNVVDFRIFPKKLADFKSGIIQKYKRKIDIPEMDPSEVIYLVLNGEKTKTLQRFIKYFNIEKFINAYPDYVRKYFNANEEKKSKIEYQFITFLLRERQDYLVDFKVKREDIDPVKGIAYVDAIISRKGPKSTYKYKYQYTLEKETINKCNTWLITNLDVTVVKGDVK